MVAPVADAQHAAPRIRYFPPDCRASVRTARCHDRLVPPPRTAASYRRRHAPHAVPEELDWRAGARTSDLEDHPPPRSCVRTRTRAKGSSVGCANRNRRPRKTTIPPVHQRTTENVVVEHALSPINPALGGGGRLAYLHREQVAHPAAETAEGHGRGAHARGISLGRRRWCDLTLLIKIGVYLELPVMPGARAIPLLFRFFLPPRLFASSQRTMSPGRPANSVSPHSDLSQSAPDARRARVFTAIVPGVAYDRKDVIPTLRTIQSTQNTLDFEHDTADLRGLLRDALAQSNDVEMLRVLQVGRAEMPEAMKTLQRALERVGVVTTQAPSGVSPPGQIAPPAPPAYTARGAAADNVLVDDRIHCLVSDFGQSEMKSDASPCVLAFVFPPLAVESRLYRRWSYGLL
ncbi:hypothetical protein DFH06DRAFT_1444980 [Mycena polygramma]|nr:hypothetical protein DFH06DRAFT_1444980 [Mycena polygramma]